MRHQIPRDAREPLRAERIEAGLLDGVEQIGGLGVVGPVSMVHRDVMKTALQDDAVREGAKSAMRRGVGLREKRVGVGDVAKRARAGRDGAKAA